MKTKEEIIEEMMHDPHWKIPDPEGLGFYANKIVEREREKFDREVSRRLKIQRTKAMNEYDKKSNQLYFVLDFLNKERKKYEKHYEENIHGLENWKSFEKMEKIDFVINMLYLLSTDLTDSHRNIQAEIQAEMNKRIEELLKS